MSAKAAAAAKVPEVHLRAGHVQPLWAGHPWVYAQAIARIDAPSGAPTVGDVVRVIDPQGNLIGRGFWSARAAIPVRIVSRDAADDLDGSAWVVAKLRAAVARRASVGLPSRATDGYRLVHAEGDELPGLVVDRFGADAEGRGGVLAVQVGTAGLRRRAAQLVEALVETCAPHAIVDRTSVSAARAEGFELEGASAISYGPPPSELRFSELGAQFVLPTTLLQKTGFYFDQRPLRARVTELAAGRSVLDAYCYVGPIGIAAARGGARSVVALDESLPALEVGAQLAQANGVTVRFERADVRRELHRRALSGERFDLVVLDPPKIAPTRGDRDAALGYQTRLIESACGLVARGGLLVVCSCSQAIGHAELARALAIGTRRAGRSATILERLGQGPDHPVPAAFPEGLYLSTIIAEVAGDPTPPPSEPPSFDDADRAARGGGGRRRGRPVGR
jgi:23S rRNA (cytosine1962-C5)-methyltransferase